MAWSGLVPKFQQSTAISVYVWNHWWQHVLSPTSCKSRLSPHRCGLLAALANLNIMVFTLLISHVDVMQQYLTPFNFIFNCTHVLGVSSCIQSPSASYWALEKHVSAGKHLFQSVVFQHNPDLYHALWILKCFLHGIFCSACHCRTRAPQPLAGSF